MMLTLERYYSYKNNFQLENLLANFAVQSKQMYLEVGVWIAGAPSVIGE